jgi:hypothetical protein
MTPGQTKRSNQEAYAELGLKASSLLASVAQTLQRADAAHIPNISSNLDSLIRCVLVGTLLDQPGISHRRVLAEVRKSVDARCANEKSKVIKYVRRLILVKEEKDAIQGLEKKIRDVMVEFQARSHALFELASVLMSWSRFNQIYASNSLHMSSFRL